MEHRNRNALLLAAFLAAPFASYGTAGAADAPAQAPVPAKAASAVVHITLDDAKARALGNNKLLNLAALNA
jgi:hypothetical protein